MKKKKHWHHWVDNPKAMTRHIHNDQNCIGMVADKDLSLELGTGDIGTPPVVVSSCVAILTPHLRFFVLLALLHMNLPKK